MRSGLESLDERERRIVELRFFSGLTQSQIAAEIGISQMHVSRLLRRALETMRGRLELAAWSGRAHERRRRTRGRSAHAGEGRSTSCWPGSRCPGSPTRSSSIRRSLADLKLAVTEACANAARHAYEDEGRVTLRLAADESEVRIEIEDEGAGFDGIAGELEPELLPEDGMGLAIIRAVVDELQVGSGEGGRGTRLRLLKRL